MLKMIGYLVFGIYLISALWLFINGLVQLHLLWHYQHSRKKRVFKKKQTTGRLPFVTVQVPVYNEKYVINRLLDAISRLDYPNHQFEIQVLDDSTDETSSIIDEKVKELRSSGLQVSVMRRSDRRGFKAGALQQGLQHCRGSLIAIFDADFIPPPTFLLDMVPHFSDPGIGLVQARWTHLNRGENGLTRIQTFLLDTHFSVEQGGRANAGYFINFCGTAGIWRRQCIEDAGGWDGDVLSEDLDLSYRAQLKGWKLVYDREVEVPAELPAVMDAFKVQQFRWTKGMAQISRKMIRSLVKASLPLGKKLHGIFHLLGSFVFVPLLLNALMTVPLLVFRNLYPEIMLGSQYALVTSLNLVGLTLYYYHGTMSAAREKSEFFKHYPLFLVVYMALSVQNAFAVVQGLLGKRSVFIRTPKFNTTQVSGASYLKPSFTWINTVELGLLLYFLSGIMLSIYLQDYFLLLFFAMISYGLGFILYQQLKHFRRAPVGALAS